MNKRRLALFALILGPILGSQGGTFGKLALREFTPWSIICLRHFIACIILFPILFKKKQMKIKWKDFPFILFVSLLWFGNVAFFAFGIQYTTVITSQVMYFFSPIFVLLLSRVLYKQQFSIVQYIGILFGFVGGVLIFSQTALDSSHDIILSLGTFRGNMLVFLAVCSWSLYLTYSKKATDKYSLLSVTTYSAFMAFLISLPFLYSDFTRHMLPLAPVTIDGVIGIIGQAVGLSVLMIFFYQYAIKHVSPFAAASVIYIAPLSAAATSIPLFGEKISAHLLLSGVIIAIGVYLATIHPYLKSKV